MQNLSEKLLSWYDRYHRELPWRISPAELRRGVRPDPYHVWLSEIMLQQTLVEAVKPYFRKFVRQWPNVAALAASEQDDVMKAWAGLGYYSRARNLKKCAETVVGSFNGTFPEDVETLKTLPGIGDYTASAIAAIAFGKAEAVVDGNVERVVTRLFAIDTPMPEAKKEIRRRTAEMLSKARPGDFAQAMMDLGATVCTPRKPACMVCPSREPCAALLQGDPERYPVKAPKRQKPLRRGAAFVAARNDGSVLLRKRRDGGLLGGMSEVPTTGWTARQDGETAISAAPFAANWQKAGEIRHVFTHFELKLTVYSASVTGPSHLPDSWWSLPHELPGEALPTVMKKVIEAALPGATKVIRPEPERTQ